MVTESELKAWMIAGLRGDEAAYRQLLAALSGRLRAFYKRLHLSADVEDLVQESLIGVHTRRHTYDPAQPLMPWVYAIAHYKFIDFLRRNKRRKGHVPIEDAERFTPDRDLNREFESAYDLEVLLRNLPEKVRCCISSVKIDGLSVRETSQRCGISESAVKVNIHRGLIKLASMIANKSVI